LHIFTTLFIIPITINITTNIKMPATGTFNNTAQHWRGLLLPLLTAVTLLSSSAMAFLPVATITSRSSSKQWAVADAPEHEEAQRNAQDDTDKEGSSSKDWIATTAGGWLPNIRKPLAQDITSIEDYKSIVVDDTESMVCVRFFAPWCRVS
jgi:hypothetical protein